MEMQEDGVRCPCEHACGVMGHSSIRSRNPCQDSMLLELAVERFAIETKRPRRSCLVVSDGTKHAEDVLTLDVRQPASRCRLWLRLRFLFEPVRKIFDADGHARPKDERSLDQVLELTNVPRPG